MVIKKRKDPLLKTSAGTKFYTGPPATGGLPCILDAVRTQQMFLSRTHPHLSPHGINMPAAAARG